MKDFVEEHFKPTIQKGNTMGTAVGVSEKKKGRVYPGKSICRWYMFGERLIVVDLEEKLSGLIVVPQGVRMTDFRWARVVAVGPDVKDIEIDDIILHNGYGNHIPKNGKDSEYRVIPLEGVISIDSEYDG